MRCRSVLVIAEGERAEERLIRSIFAISFPEQGIEVYSYGTSIHQLIDELYPNGLFDPDLDICALLAENENDEIKKEELLATYTDKYLVFDFEPQHHVLRFEQVQKMLEHFNDSTNNGKLYMNYPMLEAYRHVSKMPDLNFKERLVSIEDVRRYKQLVDNQGAAIYCNPWKYDYITLVSLTLHHLMKANQVITGEFVIPELNNYMLWSCAQIFSYQQKLQIKGLCAVMSTSVWAFVDYAPSKFFNFVTSHRGELQI